MAVFLVFPPLPFAIATQGVRKSLLTRRMNSTKQEVNEWSTVYHLYAPSTTIRQNMTTNNPSEESTDSSPTFRVRKRMKQKASYTAAALLTTLIIGVGPVSAETEGPREALSAVIDEFLDIIINVGALILFAYAAILFIKMAFQGFRGDALKKVAITVSMAILLLMFEDVITPLIRGIADDASDEASTIIADPVVTEAIAQISIHIPM